MSLVQQEESLRAVAESLKSKFRNNKFEFLLHSLWLQHIPDRKIHSVYGKLWYHQYYPTMQIAFFVRSVWFGLVSIGSYWVCQVKMLSCCSPLFPFPPLPSLPRVCICTFSDWHLSWILFIVLLSSSPPPFLCAENDAGNDNDYEIPSDEIDKLSQVIFRFVL